MKRNSKLINTFTIVGGSITHDKLVTIETLADYEITGLMRIADTVSIFGTFALICEDEYTVYNATAMVTTHPDKIELFNRDGDTYYRLHINPGSFIIESLHIAETSDLTFKFFERIRIKGKIPWFFEYEDMLTILNSAKAYGGSKSGLFRVASELLGSLTARLKSDLKKLARHYPNETDLSYIGLSNPILSTKGSMNKLLNSYSQDGIISAIVTQDDVIDEAERVLRS